MRRDAKVGWSKQGGSKELLTRRLVSLDFKSDEAGGTRNARTHGHATRPSVCLCHCLCGKQTKAQRDEIPRTGLRRILRDIVLDSSAEWRLMLRPIVTTEVTHRTSNVDEGSHAYLHWIGAKPRIRCRVFNKIVLFLICVKSLLQ